MIKISDVYNTIDDFAPFKTQLSFDNAGLLIGDMDNTVNRIAISLDATPDTIFSAHKNGCDLLVTHHPVIFGAISNISSLDVAYQAVKFGVSVISAHTNLDASYGGVNDCLCDVIGLCEVKPLSNGDDIVPLARIGSIRTNIIMNTRSFAEFAKNCIKCDCVKLTESNSNIVNVAVCGGAGSDYIVAAKNAGADALITGECKHHERLLAKQIGLTLLECGHFCTEQFIKNKLKTILLPICSDIVIIDETDPAIYI